MIRNLLVSFILLFTSTVYSQGIHIGVLGGVSAYNGDLTEKWVQTRLINGMIGLTGTYEFTDHIMARAGLSYTVLGAADRHNEDPGLKSRNLSFETKLLEFSLMGEYDLFSLNEKRFTPYALAGVAVFHFNPYTYYTGKQKVFLQPLGTEGQGIPGYADKYDRTQFALPAGLGVKYAINENLRIGLEGHIRKTFTDYIDDVSDVYADAADLSSQHGQMAVDISYRGDELNGGDPNYPAKGAQRGNPKHDDIYAFIGFHLTYRIAGNGGGPGGRGKNGLGCPTNIY